MLWRSLLLGAAAAVKFDLLPQAQNDYRWNRCISMHIGPKQLVRGYFKFSDAPDQAANAKITDTFGNNHYYRPNLPSDQVRFSFRTHDKKLKYNFCVQSVYLSAEPQANAFPREVELSIEIGHDLFDQQNANEIKIQPVVSEMVRLSGIMNDISDGLEELVESGSEISKRTRSTFKRAFFINLCAICVMVCAGVWQFYNLRRFFRTKKLI